MTTKDRILLSFLEHELIAQKYEIKKSDIPKNMVEALHSKHSIIKVIALIIEGLESKPPISDTALRKQINSFLQTAIS